MWLLSHPEPKQCNQLWQKTALVASSHHSRLKLKVCITVPLRANPKSKLGHSIINFLKSRNSISHVFSIFLLNAVGCIATYCKLVLAHRLQVVHHWSRNILMHNFQVHTVSTTADEKSCMNSCIPCWHERQQRHEDYLDSLLAADNCWQRSTDDPSLL